MIAVKLFLSFQICLSTQFGHKGDGYGGRTPTVLYNRPVSSADVGIAHRSLPMGARVLVTNLRTGKSVVATVIDRGPWGKVDEKGNWFNGRKQRKRKGRYRGCADLTPRLVQLLGHNKKELVKLELLGEDKWKTTTKKLADNSN